MATSEALSVYAILLGTLAAIAAGLTGSFALMKRVTLAGDVISHIALPGIGLAFLFGFNPLLGGATTLLLGTVVIAKLEETTGLTTDAMIGVVFAASLAAGALVTPDKDLIEALFGNLRPVTPVGLGLGLGATALVIGTLWWNRHRMILHLFSPELATTLGINGKRLNLMFMLLFGVTVLLGLQFLGALLASALIMIPPTIGRRLTHRLSHFMAISAAASVVSVLGGLAVAAWRNLPLGPTVVTFASVLFGVSLFMKER